MKHKVYAESCSPITFLEKEASVFWVFLLYGNKMPSIIYWRVSRLQIWKIKTKTDIFNL